MIPVIRRYLLDVIEREGGFVDHPNDKGGPTKYGVTKATYEDWRGKPVVIEELKNLTKEEAYAIFLKEYFIKPRLDTLPIELWEQILDCSVHHGSNRAVRLLQKACNEQLKTKLMPDGIVGPLTREAAKRLVNDVGAKEANNLLVDQRIQYFHQIVQNDPLQKVFLKGWINRANTFKV